MRKGMKNAGIAVVAILVCLLVAVSSNVAYVRNLPSQLCASCFSDVRLGVAAGRAEKGKYVFRLFGLIPIKTIETQPTAAVYIGGTPVGLTLDAQGVIVEDVGTISTGAGEVNARTNVAKGDIIIEAAEKKITGISDLAGIVNAAESATEIPLKVLRAGRELSASVTPVHEHLSGRLRLGLWLKDKVNGIGTLSFVKTDGNFGALGHAITAGGTVVPIDGGNTRECKLLGYTRGKRGTPGELKGQIRGEATGVIAENTTYGVFGRFFETPVGTQYQIGSRLDVTPGKAEIYTTLDDKPEFYSIEIIRAMPQSKRSDKSMVIRVTDKRLLETTGGIIQGMSGSPIIQNGKLVGAVTHVFVNDPTKGYGIYLDWMY